jgi:uncharacterized phage protein gp47/JayE
VLKEIRAIAVALASMGFNDSSVGSFLTLFSKSHYNNERFAAVKARGMATLSSPANSPPFPFGAEELVISTPNGTTFRNRTGHTLEPGMSLAIEWEAELSGVSGNVPSNSITQLQTTLAGVTVNNPGNWITRVGADAEQDSNLRLRNSSKWATRAYAAPGTAYEHWARAADVAITRVFVDDNNPGGVYGAVKVWIAGDDPLVDMSTSVTKVMDLITGRHRLHRERVPGERAGGRRGCCTQALSHSADRRDTHR